jgi:hypothetical protein
LFPLLANYCPDSWDQLNDNDIAIIVREVTITPNPRWGGKGSLGCDVGVGLVHRLPVTAEQSVDVDAASLVPEKRLLPPTTVALPVLHADGEVVTVFTSAHLPVAQPIATPSASGGEVKVVTGVPAMPPLATSTVTLTPATPSLAAPLTPAGFTTVPLDNHTSATAPSSSYVLTQHGVPFPSTLPLHAPPSHAHVAPSAPSSIPVAAPATVPSTRPTIESATDSGGLP